jgi:hypothetical protein
LPGLVSLKGSPVALYDRLKPWLVPPVVVPAALALLVLAVAVSQW